MAPVGYLALDMTLSSTGMIVILLLKIRAGQFFNCPVFSDKNKSLSLHESLSLLPAFADVKKVKAITAQMYNIQPAQICCWKWHFDAEAVEVASLLAAAAAKAIITMNNKSTTYIGPTKKILPEHFDHLKSVL